MGAHLALFGMVHAAGPIEDDVGAALVDARRARDRAARVRLAVLVQSIEDRAIGAKIEALQLREAVGHILGRDVVEKANVLVGVEGVHVRL